MRSVTETSCVNKKLEPLHRIEIVTNYFLAAFEFVALYVFDFYDIFTTDINLIGS